VDMDIRVLAGGSITPVVVHADDQATVRDVRRAVIDALGVPDAPIGADAAAPLDDSTLWTEAGLVRGSTIHVLGIRSRGEKVTKRMAEPLEVAVVGGLHGGLVVPLRLGQTIGIGRSHDADLPLSDHEVSREHARLTVGQDATVQVLDAGSRNGIRLNGWRLDDVATLTDGQIFRIGESVLAARRSLGADSDVRPDPATGRLLFNRPPRITSPGRLPELLVPIEPSAPAGFRFPWIMTLIPLLLCGVLYFVLPGGFGAYLLVMMAVSPLMIVMNLISDRRSGRRDHLQKKAAYEIARAKFDDALAAAAAAEEHTERIAHPDPSMLVRVAGVGAASPASTLWQRRRTDPDFLQLRVGLVDRPATVALRHDPAGASSARDTPLPALPTVYDVPLIVDLREAGVLGVAGPRSATVSGIRALLTQVAVLHAPSDLGIVLITGQDSTSDWEPASWLPHTLPASSAFRCTRMIATDAAQAESRLAELRGLIESRTAERRSTLAAGPPSGRALLVVLDGARRLRDLPGLAEILSSGPAVGVYALCLDAEETALPSECGATVVLSTSSGSRAHVRRPGLAPVDNVLFDGLIAAEALHSALALAPLSLLGANEDDTTLPERVRFVELADLPVADGSTIDTEVIRRRWRASLDGRSTHALIGIGPNGPLTVDLRRDGPHALIAGTPGSGKSELLQTLVASLAVANMPDALTFVLVDYKGGSAFAACADLPHCVGLVTDLDGRLVNRALESLSAELRRREGLLAEAGAKDIDDYWARTNDRLPRLVIVVDEFAALVEEQPEFVPGVVGIGMRGRSLGVHVVLATQRPGGVVGADLRANVNLRISLRVTSDADSTDVIDAPDAARILADHPGRGYVRTGHGELTAFQSARIGWPRPVAGVNEPHEVRVRAAVRRITTLGCSPTTSNPAGKSDVDADGHTDLSVVVDAIRRAAEEAELESPSRPWLPPLPEQLTVAALSREEYSGGPMSAVIGLVDRPTAQSQDAFVVDLEQTGPLAIAGAIRAGRSTVLRTLAATLADRTSPVDLHLYALDCGNRALAPLSALPHCGAVVDGEDESRADRLLAMLTSEVTRRQRRLAAGGHGSLSEQRCATREADRLPYVVVLLDRLETFVSRYSEQDGGRLVERVEALLRTGPAVGITLVLTTDRTGFSHRIASAVAARLVLRQATTDDVVSFGLDPRTTPRHMPPGRGVWVETAEEVQIALLDPDPAGTAQAAAVERLGARLTARWDGTVADRLPRRVDPLPELMPTTDVEALRQQDRPPGAAVCTPAVGGDRLGPIDIDLATAGGSFLITGPPRSGRSTAMVATVSTLDGRASGDLPMLIVAPRPTPVRDLAGMPGVLDVLTGDPADITAQIADAAATGPLALVIDDAELISDFTLTETLAQFARDAQDNGSVLIAAATTEDVLTNRYRGWLAAARRSRSGLLLAPTSHVDGEVFDLRLPRSVGSSWPPGRGLLVVRGETILVQVPQAVSA
jgi:DNA segregation ATPase FtsK/SpoIIIE, S-DNA-T family